MCEAFGQKKGGSQASRQGFKGQGTKRIKIPRPKGHCGENPDAAP